ncbi:MAG: acyltransferase domain-containing protein [Nocardioides sp.]|nr:acyltransferase domain-containing protein [Nocardioides sp.]
MVALLSFAVPLPPSAATQLSPDGPAVEPQDGQVWFGPALDWSDDRAADYAERLGSTASLYAQRAEYPLDSESSRYVEQFAQQVSTQGALAVLSLEPQVALGDLGPEDAAVLADFLDELHDKYDTEFLVRFAPEMNGSWVSWGQQPTAYVEAFQEVATQIHERTSVAAMVWSPTYGAGYPFGAAYGDVAPAGPEDLAGLDTTGDGIVTQADDPYGPYWPGEDAVDWVGLGLFHFGSDQGRDANDLDPDSAEPGAGDSTGFVRNQVPQPGAVEDRWDERGGYGSQAPSSSFYERFAEERDLPVLLETGALWQPDLDGADEVDIKRAWWRQVLSSLEDHPLVHGVVWLEQRRPEAEADGATVDWRATRTEALAELLLRDLAAAGIDLDPVTRVLDQETANTATAQGRLPGGQYGPPGGDELGWIIACAVLLALAFLASGIVGRWLRSWRYPDEDDPRDRRLDLFRGFIIVTVVVTHIEVGGPYSYVALKAVGAITGAEMFVLLSGIVLGMIYAPTVRRFGEWATAMLMLRRARKQYLVALAVVLIVYLMGRLPFVDASDVTTFTDRGNGPAGEAVAGQVYDLYANGPQLLLYPPPWYAVRELLLLQMGPWVFNIMGLFVVLSLALPLLMVLVRRRLWWALLLLSWAAYVVGTVWSVHLLPSQFEDVFPLLIWQLPFCHGLVLGHYRTEVTAALTSRWGKILTGLAVVAYAGVLAWLWWTHHSGISPAPFPEDVYGWLYAEGYRRVDLRPGRLIDLALMIVVTYAVLTTCWKPIDRLVGWFWIPLGQASLYVFIVHVFFAVAVGNVPGLDRADWWQGAVVHTVVLAAIWWMVRRRVLFAVIPR